ncbi:PBP2_Bug_TTT domain containing protein [Sphingomonadaceae bacterium]
MKIDEKSAPHLNRRLVLVGGAALAISPVAVFANDAFPQRPLSFLVPANPGGGWDQLARLMQQVVTSSKLSPKPIDVFNKGGAGGAIGLAEMMTRRHDDPYTLMVAGSVMIGSTIAQQSPFRASQSQPLARLILENLVVAVPADSPYQSMAQFIEAFRTNPSAISWCGGSAGGVDHILVGLITEACGLSSDKVRYVAYSGGGEASAAIMGGQVTAAVAGFGEWKALADAGHIRLLATAAPERFGDRTTPTLKEVGLNVVLQNWRGVFAAPGAPNYAIAWWQKLLREMRNQPSWKLYLANKGWEDGFLEGAAFADYVAAEEKLNAKTLARLGIGANEGGNSPVGPWAVPKAIAALGVAAAVGVAAEHYRAQPGESVLPAGLEDDDEGGGPLPVWSRFIAGACIVPMFIAALYFVGFAVATPVFIIAICVLMRSSTLKWDAVAALGITGGIWLLFSRILAVALP